MKLKYFAIIYLISYLFIGCSMKNDKGQAVGFVTHFSRSGTIWKSWELELNKSQTGMTSTANELDLSVDNDNEDQEIINILDSAQKYGWKVQIDYQQNFGVNCMNNRGETSRFIKKVEVLDKNPLGGIKSDSTNGGFNNATQHLLRNGDTIYFIEVKQK
jgi:hypothetical protein